MPATPQRGDFVRVRTRRCWWRTSALPVTAFYFFSEASRAIRQAEVRAARITIERTEQRMQPDIRDTVALCANVSHFAGTAIGAVFRTKRL